MTEIAWSVSGFVVAVFIVGLCAIGITRAIKPRLTDYRILWRAYLQECLVVGVLLVTLIVGGWLFYFALLVFALRALFEIVHIFIDQSRSVVLSPIIISFVIFIIVSLLAIGLVRTQFDWPIILFAYVVVEVNDATAYVFGKLFGKKRVFPRLSPGKTQFGFFAGLAGGLGAGLSYGLFVLNVADWFFLLGISFVTLVGGLCGDLFTSYVKRNEKIKDFRSVLSGQGGALDIFDAFLGGSLALGLVFAALAMSGFLP